MKVLQSHDVLLILLIVLRSISAAEDYIVIKPRSKIRKEVGASVSLTCIVQCPYCRYSHPISWKTPGDRNNIKVYSAPGYSRLVVDKLQLSDSGDYVCNVTHDHSRRHLFTTKKVVHVNVINVLKKCQSKFLQCSSGHCIPQRYLCDGRQDCPEGSDEETGRCGRDVCGGKIRCADGRCIPKSLCCYPNEDAACKATYVLPCCMQFLRHRLHAKIRHNLAVHNNTTNSSVDASRVLTPSGPMILIFAIISLPLLGFSVVLGGFIFKLMILRLKAVSSSINPNEGPICGNRRHCYARRIYDIRDCDDATLDPPGIHSSNLTACPSYSEACLDDPPPYGENAEHPDHHFGLSQTIPVGGSSL